MIIALLSCLVVLIVSGWVAYYHTGTVADLAKLCFFIMLLCFLLLLLFSALSGAPPPVREAPSLD